METTDQERVRLQLQQRPLQGVQTKLSQQPLQGVPQRVAPGGIGVMNMPSQAESLRAGTPLQSPVQRAPASPLPQPVNAAPSGDATARIGQRLANISGEPYRDPRGVFNRPINVKPAVDAVASAGGKVAGAAKTVAQKVLPSAQSLGRAAVGLGGVVEASRAGFDMLTPGMNDLDKTARAAEGVGRFGLATAGAMKGAAVGSALGLPGSVVGGIAGGLAGAYAPEMLNSAVNKVSGFFGGPDQNQLASQKAADLRARNGMPPPPGQQQAKPPAMPPTSAGAGRGFVNPALVTPSPEQPAAVGGPARGEVRRTPQAKAPAATPAPAPAPAAAPQGIGANPMDGVMFTTLGDNYLGGMGRAYMADGRVIDGPDAMKIINDSNAYFEANPTGASPIEVIRGGVKSTAIPELGYGEIGTAEYESLQANGGIGRLTEAVAQGTVDGAAPEQAKIRGALEERALANEGGAKQAAISAGPGYARVAEDRRQFGQTRQDGIDGIGTKIDPNAVVVVPGGQEVVDVGGMPTTITRPSRVLDRRTLKYIDGEAGVSGQISKQMETDEKAIAIRDNKSLSREQKVQELKKLGY